MQHMKRLLVMLGAMVAVLAMAAPARAGNWAVTEVDPLPATIQPNVAYTIGYWVLQHGTHPFEGPEKELGQTGLRLTGGDGTTLTFEGTRLPEPAHYAVSVRIPAGTWRLTGVQGIFAPYEIGTLTVPGRLTPAPPQFPASTFAEVTDYWGEIKPPGFPWKATPVSPFVAPAVTAGGSTPGTDAAGTVGTGITAAPTAAAAAASPVNATAGSGAWPQPYALLAVAVAAVAATLLVQRAARARVQREPAARTETDQSGPSATSGTDAADVITLGRGG
jgi:hypothetical protein